MSVEDFECLLGGRAVSRDKGGLTGFQWCFNRTGLCAVCFECFASSHREFELLQLSVDLVGIVSSFSEVSIVFYEHFAVVFRV